MLINHSFVMKKIILLLLNVFLGYSQGYLEVKLVDENVGYPDYYQDISNDAGLNTILSNHNVLIYETKTGNPFDYSSKYVNVKCTSCNISNLKNDLQNYNTVIEYVDYGSQDYFNKMLTIKILNATTGIQTGTNGNFVVTNDTGLNQIFSNHNIVEMQQSFPSSTNSNNLRYYYIRSSSCDLNILKTTLDNYSTVIEATEYVPASAFLNNELFDKNTTSIYPNPFQNELNIETNKLILTYEVIDISGKKIINSNNKIDFNTSISQLKNEIYFLQLNYDDTTNSSHKIIKN